MPCRGQSEVQTRPWPLPDCVGRWPLETVKSALWIHICVLPVPPCQLSSAYFRCSTGRFLPLSARRQPSTPPLTPTTSSSINVHPFQNRACPLFDQTILVEHVHDRARYVYRTISCNADAFVPGPIPIPACWREVCEWAGKGTRRSW